MMLVQPDPQIISFDAFYRAEYSAMVALAAATSGVPSSGEDLAQEALIRAHGQWDRICSYDKPGAWLRRTTINLALNTRRSRRRERRALSVVGRQRSTTVTIVFDDSDVWTAVASLPGQQRAAVALFYLEDRSVADIAEILACAHNTAKAHLHNGRLRLAELLEEDSP